MDAEAYAKQAAEIEAQRNEMEAALLLTEFADLAHSECDECGGESDPTICGACFPLSDQARVARRKALCIPDILDAPEGQTLDEIAAQVSGGKYVTMRDLLDDTRRIAGLPAKKTEAQP